MLHKTKADSYFLFPDIHPVTQDSLKTAELRELITAHPHVVTCEQFNKKDIIAAIKGVWKKPANP